MGSLLDGYVAGRKELAELILLNTERNSVDLHYAADVLWSNAWCDAEGVPHEMFPSRWRSRCEVIGAPASGGSSVEKIGDWRRFQTTTNWGLDLAQWSDAEAYFKALSKKMRKKLGWLRNSYPRLNVHYDPIDSSVSYDRFLALFRSRWPGSDWENEYYDRFLQTIQRLAEKGQWLGEIMVDEENHDVAAFTGYYTANAYNLHLLCRADGLLEKYSPGFYLVWHLIEHLYKSNRVRYCFLGPGRFDYKVRFMAQELPVYRYEKNRITNLPGVVRLYHRARKQHLRRG